MEQMPFSISFENTFILISLNIPNIETEENLDIDKSKNFNINIQTYLTFKREYKEFTIIKINFNTAKRDNKEHPYNKDDLYFKLNNTEHYNII